MRSYGDITTAGGLWAGWGHYRATPAVKRVLGLNGLIRVRRIALFIVAMHDKQGVHILVLRDEECIVTPG